MSQKTILIADDDQLFTEALRAQLTQWGYEVCSCVTAGELAISEAERLHPDLVLMDILLEGAADGIVATYAISSRFSIPVILISGYGDEATLKRIRLSGASQFLTKPVNFKELGSAIDFTLSRSQKERTKVSWAFEILQQTRDCAIATDENAIIQYINPAAQGLTGWSMEDACGRNLSDVFKLEDVENANGSLPIVESAILIDRSDRKIDISHDSVLLRNGNNSLSGFAVLFRDVTQVKMAEKSVRQSRLQLKDLMDSIDGIVWESDLTRENFHFVSSQVSQVLGFSIQDWLNEKSFWHRRVHPEDVGVIVSLEKAMMDRKKDYILQYRVRDSDGLNVWIKDHVKVVYENNIAVRLRGIMEDVTARKHVERRLSESEEEYRWLVDSAPDIILGLSNQEATITMLNPAFEKITGMPRDSWIGRSFFSLLHPDDFNDAVCRYQQALSGETVTAALMRLLSSSGVFVIGEVTLKPKLKNGEVVGVAGTIHDVSERIRNEERLIRNAFYDGLTGLPNRALFMDRLNHTIARTNRKDFQPYAVLFLDLDRFKLINDSLGHLFGDQLLSQIARRLQVTLRPEDTIGRIGGDEFVILLDHLDDSADCVNIVRRIQNQIAEPFHLDSQEIFTSASIGIAFGTADYKKGEELLRDADIAMYRAKSMGRGYEIFDSSMHFHVVSLLRKETDFRRGLENHEFAAHYQPILSLSGRKLIGFEALARWNHPERGWVPACEFIPLAEETGLIDAIGQIVLSNVCGLIRRCETELGEKFPFRINVNLSPRQFSDPSLVKRILDCLEESQVSASQLTLEITESALLESGAQAEKTLQQLHNSKFRLEIDDFGTGYSSLSYLRHFPIDGLKIDRSFIQPPEKNLEIVRTILALAKSLKLSTTAEGVESAQQADRLRSLGCNAAQGNFFSVPLEPSAVLPFVKLQRNSASRSSCDETLDFPELSSNRGIIERL